MPGKKYNFTEKEIKQIREDYLSGLSLRETAQKWNIKSNSKIQEILKDVIRTNAEANKLAHQKHPDAFKHSDETKEIMREKRLKFMREHPEKTAWRRSNMSYPEQQFIKFLEEKGYSEKFLIEREKSVYPYFIDFAFTDLKIAIEIDGSQHLEEDRKRRDDEKDKLLQSQGWRVIRIAESIVKTDWNLLQQTIEKYINLETEETFEKIGIVKALKTREKVKRNENGLSEKQQKRQDEFLAALPNRDILLQQVTTMSFTKVGEIYGVTDNCIRKWCDKLDIPRTKYKMSGKATNKLSDKVCINCGKVFHPKDAKNKFCCRQCADDYAFKNSKIVKIPKEQVQKLIDEGVGITKAARLLNITRSSLSRLCKRYNLSFI